MRKYDTAYRLKQIMREKNLSQIDVLRLAEPLCEKYNIKLSKSALSQYTSGKVEPGQDKLFILGMVLGVSEAWLMGYEVPETKKIELGDISAAKLDSEVMHLFSTLSEDKKKAVVEFVRYVAGSK